MSDLDRQASGSPSYDEPDYPACKKCGSELDWAYCWMHDCEEGWYDAYEEDPINNSPGDMEACSECNGQGGWWYCANCERSAQQHTPDSGQP